MEIRCPPAVRRGKFLELLKKISPVAWQHIHFLGHYRFRDNRHPIDWEAILASLLPTFLIMWGLDKYYWG
jgi:hypothetical protein